MQGPRLLIYRWLTLPPIIYIRAKKDFAQRRHAGDADNRFLLVGGLVTDRYRLILSVLPTAPMRLSVRRRMATSPCHTHAAHTCPQTERHASFCPAVRSRTCVAPTGGLVCWPSSRSRDKISKIRLLGFTTLHDSRRYTIPRCLGPSHPDTKARCTAESRLVGRFSPVMFARACTTEEFAKRARSRASPPAKATPRRQESLIDNGQDSWRKAFQHCAHARRGRGRRARELGGGGQR